MKRKDIQKYILLLLFMVTAQLAFAQSFTLQGKVSDKEGNPNSSWLLSWWLRRENCR